MDLQERKQELLGQYVHHRDELDRLRKEIDAVEALEVADWQKEQIGKCFINRYDAGDEELSYFTISRVEYFDRQGRARGTSITVSNSGRQSIYFGEDLWHVAKGRSDRDVDVFPETAFAEIADEVTKEIESNLKEFLKDLDAWKTKRPDSTMNFWTRIQRVLSSMGLKSRPFEMEE